VEVIRRSGSNGRDGDWLRVQHHGYVWAEARTVTELARLGTDVADLIDAD